jgi:hypothetical protein
MLRNQSRFGLSSYRWVRQNKDTDGKRLGWHITGRAMVARQPYSPAREQFTVGGGRRYHRLAPNDPVGCLMMMVYC